MATPLKQKKAGVYIGALKRSNGKAQARASAATKASSQNTEDEGLYEEDNTEVDATQSFGCHIRSQFKYFLNIDDRELPFISAFWFLATYATATESVDVVLKVGNKDNTQELRVGLSFGRSSICSCTTAPG